MLLLDSRPRKGYTREQVKLLSLCLFLSSCVSTAPRGLPHEEKGELLRNEHLPGDQSDGRRRLETSVAGSALPSRSHLESRYCLYDGGMQGVRPVWSASVRDPAPDEQVK